MKNTDMKAKLSRIIPIVLIILLILIAIFALVQIGKAIFNRNRNTAPKETTIVEKTLLKIDESRGVRMTVRGPIVADENFASYQITIKPTKRVLNVYKGYLEQRVDGVELSNNSRAYEEFVYALDKRNFDVGTPLTGDKDDIRGICATGTVIEFDTLQDDKSTKHLWTSTCKGSLGSFRANTESIRSLFFKQIPQAETILSKF